MSLLANVFNPVPWVIGAIVLLMFFGGQKIPEMMRGLGQGAREFKKGLHEENDDELNREKDREAEIRRRVEEEMRKEGR